MTHVILCDGQIFRMERWGNGLSYELTHKPSGMAAYMRGECAARFDDDLRACEDNFPDNTTEQNAAWLWDQCEYSSIAV
jgi:hypothetical protein